ncbi:hypothetical protein PCANC_17381 [Puccinia coronata f. sp. avenae]|uniref:Uncharacterized protein n=1 Tax=Puccinia coronata f. sp. avenae TaxID=200324 RepID=A0A2N5UZW5_9BASI|nr:hypothetical protein PCASD_12273 [Puccinia coronata f. sp. avenae]PLW43274.1 hypothetical protein PCANC_17381 [Puccinia coronata f. sp. avenae]
MRHSSAPVPWSMHCQTHETPLGAAGEAECVSIQKSERTSLPSAIFICKSLNVTYVKIFRTVLHLLGHTFRNSPLTFVNS